MRTTTKESAQRALIAQYDKRRTALKADELYSLEAILGEAFWDETDFDHRALGHYFCKLAAKRLLPFEFVGFTKQRHNQYRYLGTSDEQPAPIPQPNKPTTRGR